MTTATPLVQAPPEPEVHVKPRFRGWSHVWGFVCAASLGGVIIGLTPSGWARAEMVIYVVGLCTMLGVSALYHRRRWSVDGLAFMRRLDHSTIFLAIAGSYTPIAGICLHGWQRPTMLATVWGGSAIGISLQWLHVRAPRWLETAIYAVVGWVAFLAVPQLFSGMGALGFSFVLAGGVAYTAGAVVYALKRPDPWPATFGYHEVFHALTLIGASFHMAAIAFTVLPKA